MRSEWRDCKAWSLEGLSLSTTSNQACKLYDASLSQYTGWYDDPSVGGLENSLTQMLDSDPNFVMGKVLAYGLEVLGTGTPIQKQDSNIVLKINSLQYEVAKQQNTLTSREMSHVKALRAWADGNLELAIEHWEDVLVLHPKDMHAIKMLQDTYFYLGQQTQMRDSIARILPEWDKKDQLQNYLYGMYAFGLVETNRYDEAEQNALLGLDLNRKDGWATHALTHVYEMTGQIDKGLAMLDKTVADWEFCKYLSCHTYWHWALFHVERNEPEAALEIFERKICPSAVRSEALLDYVDAASLLYRLQLEDVDVSHRWSPVCKIAEKHKNDHVLLFNDAHFLMAFLGNRDDGLAIEFFNSCKEFMKIGKGQSELTREVGGAMLEGIIAYDRKEYTQAVDLLNSIKYKLVKIGGSNAQRDVFNILLLNAAVRSSTPYHLALAKVLINERKAKKQNSPLTDRILEKLLSNKTKIKLSLYLKN